MQRQCLILTQFQRGSQLPASASVDGPDSESAAREPDIEESTRNLFASLTGSSTANPVDALREYLDSDVLEYTKTNPLAYWLEVDTSNAERAALARMAIDYLGAPGMYTFSYQATLSNCTSFQQRQPKSSEPSAVAGSPFHGFATL